MNSKRRLHLFFLVFIAFCVINFLFLITFSFVVVFFVLLNRLEQFSEKFSKIEIKAC